MKKILIILLLLLAACGSAQPPAGEQSGQSADNFATEGNPTAESPAESPAETPAPAIGQGTAVFPATTPAEAAIVRPQDWTLGAANPIVTIIEYGDFQ